MPQNRQHHANAFAALGDTTPGAAFSCAYLPTAIGAPRASGEYDARLRLLDEHFRPLLGEPAHGDDKMSVDRHDELIENIRLLRDEHRRLIEVRQQLVSDMLRVADAGRTLARRSQLHASQAAVKPAQPVPQNRPLH